MVVLVFFVLAVLVVTGGADAFGPGYDSPPVYRQKSSLQSRRRPFQSTLKPISPYDDSHNVYPPRPYLPLKTYREYDRSPDELRRRPSYGVSPYEDLLRSLLGDYPRPSHDDYSRFPYRAYSNRLEDALHAPYAPVPPSYASELYELSRSGKYLPPHKSTVSPPIYPTKYPQQPRKSYIKPPVLYRPSNSTTTTARPYSFSYDLVDVRGNDFGAAEESDGRQVQGQYSVLLPDGRLQTVSYAVEGDSGFVADVQYEGEARFVNEDGEEEGRSSVKMGRGPTGGYRDSHRV
ncbi:hypothetical protein FJT64_018222 [Amphibalanus amphitrite]|uniref:Pro-resilin n=1 Tax=Amphibalanus amphitrite TaxID=1232801 RepID=A0A6A4WYB8_AMPAM|nr:uncharacterized protein LOC122391273 [Amphibalanus amphitrite]KAF0310913.1 hypothetical protein FJT64_018222 [Amphibalanus amphitrite]